jgi:uncharacterized damage-inducible protein DinB
MGSLSLIREMYEHGEWASNQVLAAAGKLPEEKLREKPLGAYMSVIAGLSHVGAAQLVWLSRWRTGETDQSVRVFGELESLASVRELFDRAHSEMRDYLGGLSEEQVEETLEYTDSRGNRGEWSRRRMLMHLANHGTYHRGEIGMCLTALGESPGELDLLSYLRTR